jgi:putative transcriptional regulator
MKKDMFDELMRSAHGALEHARGERALRTIAVPPPPPPLSAAELRHMRLALNASQAVFARFLNVSTRLVQAWEADRRTPDGAAARLLEVGRRHPRAVFGGLVAGR